VNSASDHTQRLCLHALSITFIHPTSETELTFTSSALSY
jgi:23S rRNA-/tRNA-specific pseudouridylate synthase